MKLSARNQVPGKIVGVSTAIVKASDVMGGK